jgi:hypothetical protein
VFHTIRYRGHHIHVSILDGVETIKTQISTPDGRFDLQMRKTYAGAQRAITKHVRTATTASGNR